MEGLVFCNKGIEDIVVLDVNDIIGKKGKIFDGFVVFDFEKKEELCKLAYLSQSIRKAVLILDSFSFKTEEEIIDRAGKLDLKGWLNEDNSFKVDVLIEKCEIDQEELKGEIGESVIRSIKKYRQRVDLEEPDIVLYVFVHMNKAYYCIDFSGKNLSKREYRIFSSPKNIKSTLAYAMVRLSGYKKGDFLVDPFCLSGSIPIEAALFENDFPVRYFDKDDFLFSKFIEFDFEKVDKKATKDKGNIFAFDSHFKNVDAAKKNAKIAGINKSINFSRLEINWLDTKLEKKSIDRVVSCLPDITRFSNKKEIMKLYKEFFHQVEFVLKKMGKVVVCTKNPSEVEKEAKEKGFKAGDEREVWQGQEMLCIIKFEKD